MNESIEKQVIGLEWLGFLELEYSIT